MRFPRAWLLLPFLVWLLPRAAAAAPIALEGSADHHAVIPHLEALVDPGGALGIEEVAARDFRPLDDLEEGLGRWPGERQPIVWMRFSVQVPPDAHDW